MGVGGGKGRDGRETKGRAGREKAFLHRPLPSRQNKSIPPLIPKPNPPPLPIPARTPTYPNPETCSHNKSPPTYLGIRIPTYLPTYTPAQVPTHRLPSFLPFFLPRHATLVTLFRIVDESPPPENRIERAGWVVGWVVGWLVGWVG